MALNPAMYSTRTLSLLLLSAFAGTALWFFQPWSGSGSGSGGGAGASAPAAVKIAGVVAIEANEDVVTRVRVPLAVSGRESVGLGPGANVRAETELSDSATAAVPGSYTVEWTSGNGDDTLEPGEQAMLIVDLPAKSSVHPDNPLRLVLRYPDGRTVAVDDVISP